MIKWLDENLEEALLAMLLCGMALVMGIQVFSRYTLGSSLSWSEELTRYMFIWSAFLSISYCTKRCISIKIEQFIHLFSEKNQAVLKLINHTIELGLFSYLIPYSVMGSVKFYTPVLFNIAIYSKVFNVFLNKKTMTPHFLI